MRRGEREWFSQSRRRNLRYVYPASANGGTTGGAQSFSAKSTLQQKVKASELHCESGVLAQEQKAKEASSDQKCRSVGKERDELS